MTKKRTDEDARSLWAIVGQVTTGLPVSKTIQFRTAMHTRSELKSADEGVSDTQRRSIVVESNSTTGVPDQPFSESGEDSNAKDTPPDISAEFKGEMEALRSFYAARIGAARRSMSGQQLVAFLQTLIGEQTVAMRALAERWQAAGQKQRDEQPRRPTTSEKRGKAGPEAQ